MKGFHSLFLEPDMPNDNLPLYQEYLLLALRDKEGIPFGGMVEHPLAGALLAELFLRGHLKLEGKTNLVSVVNRHATGDKILNSALAKIVAAKRRASLNTWVSRIAGTAGLRRNVALALCDQKILKADRGKVLLIFTREIFPELNPVPEKKVMDRLRKAIFADQGLVDQRTAVLVSLANVSGLLACNFGRKEIKARKRRIDQIVKGEVIGKATQEVIAAFQAAVMVAVMVPTIVAATSASN